VFDVEIKCYDDTPALLGTLVMLLNDNVWTSWEDPIAKAPSTGVIHPVAEGDPLSFPAGTTQIKRVFRNDSGVASSMVIDWAYFSESDYFTKPGTFAGSGLDTNRVEYPCTVFIPDTDLKGDVESEGRLSLDGMFTLHNLMAPFAPSYVHHGQTEDNEASVLIMKGISGAVVMDWTRLDQYYTSFPGVGAASEFFEIASIPLVGNSTGRYVPMISMHYSGTTPAYADISISCRLYSITAGAVITDWVEVTNTARWIQGAGEVYWMLSGYANGLGESFGRLSAINIPFIDIPEYQDADDVIQQFKMDATLSVNGDLFIDYLALIPIHSGYVYGSNIVVGDIYLDVDGRKKSIFFSSDVDRYTSSGVGIDEWVGEADLQVNPQGTEFVIVPSHGGGEDGGGVEHSGLNSPQHTYNMELSYMPRYLLVSEE